MDFNKVLTSRKFCLCALNKHKKSNQKEVGNQAMSDIDVCKKKIAKDFF